MMIFTAWSGMNRVTRAMVPQPPPSSWPDIVYDAMAAAPVRMNTIRTTMSTIPPSLSEHLSQAKPKLAAYPSLQIEQSVAYQRPAGFGRSVCQGIMRGTHGQRQQSYGDSPTRNIPTCSAPSVHIVLTPSHYSYGLRMAVLLFYSRSRLMMTALSCLAGTVFMSYDDDCA